MSAQDDGGPAFPSEQGYTPQGWNQTYDAGMSVRDWFAGQALAGMLAQPSSDDPDSAAILISSYAKDAYRYADAMLLERKKAP